MPVPAPPPRLTFRSADVHAGVPGADALAPEAAGLEAALDAAELAALDETVAEAAADDEVADAAQPVARTPAASSGMSSNAFFTRSPDCHGIGHFPDAFTTPHAPYWLGGILARTRVMSSS
jgi:hypothetical protein